MATLRFRSNGPEMPVYEPPTSYSKYGDKTPSFKLSAQMKFAILIMFLGAFAFMGASTWLVLTGKIDLSGGIEPNDLIGYATKAEFAFRYMALGVFWLIFS